MRLPEVIPDVASGEQAGFVRVVLSSWGAELISYDRKVGNEKRGFKHRFSAKNYESTV